MKVMVGPLPINSGQINVLYDVVDNMMNQLGVNVHNNQIVNENYMPIN